MLITDLNIGDVFKDTINGVDVRRVVLSAPRSVDAGDGTWTTVKVAESYGPDHRGVHNHSITVPSTTEVSLTSL